MREMEWTEARRDVEVESESSSLMEEELSQGEGRRKGSDDAEARTREPATEDEGPNVATDETDKSKAEVWSEPNASADVPVHGEGEEEEEVEIKSTDMDEAKVLEAVRVAREALQVDKLEKAVAETVKKHFDGKYGVNWHCIVGQSFGSFVTHREGAFLYAYVGKYAILLYKT
eukprot:jgi/Pico_ML_1/54370/g4729.t1